MTGSLRTVSYTAGMRNRWKYIVTGLAAGFVFFWLLGDFLGKHNIFALLLGSMSGGNLALWIAQCRAATKLAETARKE